MNKLSLIKKKTM